MNCIIIVAYNAPHLLRLQLPAIRKHVTNCDVIILDNSGLKARLQNIDICNNHYCEHRTMHFKNGDPSRHHASALNYAFDNICGSYEKVLFVDHDAVPFRRITCFDNDFALYGVHQERNGRPYIHPGFIKMQEVWDLPLNFMPCAGMDTGGRLHHWEHMMTYCNAHAQEDFEIWDNGWLHMIKGSNWNGAGDYDARFEAFKNCLKAMI